MTMQETLSKTFTVMVVASQEIFRQGLHTLLDDIEGFHVVAEVDTGKALFERLQADLCDLILLDISLPNTSSQEMILSLQEVASAPAFIVFSDTVDDELLVQAALLGASGYLTKDLPKKAVVEALRNWRQGAFAFTPAIATRLVQCLVGKYQKLERFSSSYAEMKVSDEDQPVFASAHANHIQPSVKAAAHSPLQKLTQQEQRVFLFMHQGLSNKQIAARLAISPYTVGKHVQQILRKLGASNRTQAASYTPFKGDMSVVHEM